MPTNPLSTVGLMLTLASLIGSFFYLQLSQWLRDVLALRQKTELNELQGDQAQQRAIVECKVEYRKLTSWHSYVVNVVVIAFVLFVLLIGLDMIRLAKSDPLYRHIHLAFTVFLWIFIVLSFGLMALGAANAEAVRGMLYPPPPQVPAPVPAPEAPVPAPAPVD